MSGEYLVCCKNHSFNQTALDFNVENSMWFFQTLMFLESDPVKSKSPEVAKEYSMRMLGELFLGSMTLPSTCTDHGDLDKGEEKPSEGDKSTYVMS